MFVVLLTGQGEGCDFTIGCNRCWRDLRAATWEEALAEVPAVLQGFGEPQVATATILHVVAAQDFPVASWRQLQEAEQARRDQEAQKELRRRQYEELRREFGEPVGGEKP
jgi:hypothetical protein